MLYTVIGKKDGFPRKARKKHRGKTMKKINKKIILTVLSLSFLVAVLPFDVSKTISNSISAEDEDYSSYFPHKDNIMLANVNDNKVYWFENNKIQGTNKDPKGVYGWDDRVKKNINRGREIYNQGGMVSPGGAGWHWLDSVYGGAVAFNKEVWMPYIYQDEASWDDATKKTISLESDSYTEKSYYYEKAQLEYHTVNAKMSDQVYNAMKNGTGKWVRYSYTGSMVKGWYAVVGKEEDIYPDQKGNVYYYDYKTGLMAKGETVIDGITYIFDELTGVLKGKLGGNDITTIKFALSSSGTLKIKGVPAERKTIYIYRCLTCHQTTFNKDEHIQEMGGLGNPVYNESTGQWRWDGEGANHSSFSSYPDHNEYTPHPEEQYRDWSIKHGSVSYDVTVNVSNQNVECNYEDIKR